MLLWQYNIRNKFGEKICIILLYNIPIHLQYNMWKIEPENLKTELLLVILLVH